MFIHYYVKAVFRQRNYVQHTFLHIFIQMETDDATPGLIIIITIIMIIIIIHGEPHTGV